MSQENPYAPPETNPTVPNSEDAEAPLAGRGQRLIAALIDVVILMAVILPIAILFGLFGALEGNGNLSFAESLMWGIIGFVCYIGINWIPLQGGQTWGKRIRKIKVVMRDGSPIAAQRYVTHRILPIQLISQIPMIGIVVSLVDALLIFRADRNTLHDDIAGTKVIQLETA